MQTTADYTHEDLQKNEKSRQELHEWYWSDDVQDILNHNYNRYFDFAKEEIKKVVEIML